MSMSLFLYRLFNLMSAFVQSQLFRLFFLTLASFVAIIGVVSLIRYILTLSR